MIAAHVRQSAAWSHDRGWRARSRNGLLAEQSVVGFDHFAKYHSFVKFATGFHATLCSHAPGGGRVSEHTQDGIGQGTGFLEWYQQSG